MNRLIFIVFLLFIVCNSLFGQTNTYKCTYIIRADTGYANANEVEPYLARFRSWERKTLFIGNVFTCIVNKERIDFKLNTKYEQDLKRPIGGIMESKDSILYKDGFATTTFNPDSSFFNHHYIFDIKNRRSYDIQTYPQIEVSCKQMDAAAKFEKTKERKVIDKWLCAKWVPKDKEIKGKVSFWVCDSIPKEVRKVYLSDQFDGGIVRIESVVGYWYDLVDYSKVTEDAVLMPIPACTKEARVWDDFLKVLAYGIDGIKVESVKIR